MRDSLVGSGVRRPPGRRLFPYLSGKPKPTGDLGVQSAECDRTRWVTVVSTLGAEVRHSSSPPSLTSSTLALSPPCHSMASGALGSEDISSTSIRKLIFCFLPKLRVLQTLGLSVSRRCNTRRTTPVLFLPLVRNNGNLHLRTTGIRFQGLWW